MGGSASCDLSDAEIDEVRKCTNFSKSEIIDMYEKFQRDFPEGVITRRKFIEMYAAMFPDGDARAFAKHVFRAYDMDGNGTIEFDEFMTSLSVSMKGTAEEKLRWAFRLYDFDGNGEISQCEASDMICAIYRMQGTRNARDKAEQTTLELFYQLDKDRNDALTRTEFINAVRSSSVIKSLLQGGH